MYGGGILRTGAGGGGGVDLGEDRHGLLAVLHRRPRVLADGVLPGRGEAPARWQSRGLEQLGLEPRSSV